MSSGKSPRDPLTPNSRSYLNRFSQPDTIIPVSTQGVQAYDRYTYSNNNPVRFNDPTGHMANEGEGGGKDGCTNPKYCQNGKPKSKNILAEMRSANLNSDCAYKNQFACNHPTQRLTAGSPDYITLNLGGSIPGVGTFVSGQLAVTLDRFGNLYAGPGLALGPEAPLGFSASISGGYLNTWTNSLDPDIPEEGPPGEQRSENILSGGYGNFSVCLAFCGGLTNSLSSPNNVGFEVLGLGVPQLSFGVGYSFLIDFTPNNGKPLW